MALTLRLVAGLETEEIARAFLVPMPTMGQRLSRAKATLREAGDGLDVPGRAHRAERLSAVGRVIYLVFNEGYARATGSELIDQQLVDEGLRLGELLVELTDQEPEMLGLLALMRIQASRTAARVDDGGHLVLLEDQDRTRWDRALANQGCRDLVEALTRGRPGPYQLQAAIAACHAEAPTWPDTDWMQIIALYDHFQTLDPSPVIALNRAVAVGVAHGAERGLAETEALADAPGMARYHLWHACRADWLRRLGRHAEAVRSYEAALQRTNNVREQAFLRGRLREAKDGLQ